MSDIITKLGGLIDTAESMKNAYFFHSPTCAGARRSYEKSHSCDRIEWTENGHIYTAEFTVRCSCRNIYTYSEYTRDGKKTTLTAIRNSYKRLAAAEA